MKFGNEMLRRERIKELWFDPDIGLERGWNGKLYVTGLTGWPSRQLVRKLGPQWPSKGCSDLKYNIGDEIKYLDEYGESCVGTIQGVLSDMDSYDEMKFKDGVSYYASKKLTAAENLRRKKAKKSPLASPIFAPVKPKNMASVFLEIAPSNNPYGIPDYIPLVEIKNV